jgi:heme/copper-type cytochrome/quinol oxidase subunit 2
MSNAQRVLLLVAGAAVLVVALIVLSPGSDDNDNTTTTAAPAVPATTTPGGRTVTATATAPEATPNLVTVRGGKPVGGIQTITAHKDDTVRFTVASPDTTSEVHLHGYDIMRDLTAGGRVNFVFKAVNEGIFEAELEETSTQIIKLVIEP